MLLLDCPFDAINFRCNGISLVTHCQRDGGHIIYVARALTKPNDTGPNVLLSNECPVWSPSIQQWPGGILTNGFLYPIVGTISPANQTNQTIKQ